MEELHQFLAGRTALSANCLTAIMALDVLIRHDPSMKYSTVGRSFYTPQGAQALFGGAEVWQGYYQSARPTLGKMMINIDLSATAFYESGSLVSMVTKILGRRDPNDFRRGLSDRDRIKVEKELKGLKICVRHRGEAVAKRRYRILRLTETNVENTSFVNAEGTTMNVATYFQSKYGRLSYTFLPCVVVRRDDKLPMEVCEVVQGQRHLRKLNEKQTADMIKFTCQNPSSRANKIKEGLNILNYRDNEYMKQFGMKVSNEMITAPARVLQTPFIEYHPSSREARFQPRDGTWNLRDKKVATGATLGSWSVIMFGPERDFPVPAVNGFIRELVITCQDTGLVGLTLSLVK